MDKALDTLLKVVDDVKVGRDLVDIYKDYEASLSDTFSQETFLNFLTLTSVKHKLVDLRKKIISLVLKKGEVEAKVAFDAVSTLTRIDTAIDLVEPLIAYSAIVFGTLDHAYKFISKLGGDK